MAGPRHLLRCLAVAGVALLAGCSSVSRGSLESIRLAVQGVTVSPTAASVAATPYFQLQANGPGGQAILILASAADGQLGWYGSAGDILTTRDGLLVKTVGLPQNLDGSAFPGVNPFQAGLQHVRGPLDYTRRMDWSPGYRYGVILQAHLDPGALEDITILGKVHHVRRLDETLTVPGQGIRMTNRYWIDPADGFLWQSRQYVAPGYPLELIQLQPYVGPSP
jgi:hypothetical protein